MGGVIQEAGPSSPSSPPPPPQDVSAGQSVPPSPSPRYSPHHGLEGLSSSSSSGDDDDDDVARTDAGVGSGHENGDGGEKEKGSLHGGDGGHGGPHGGDGLLGTPGQAGHQGPPMSTPHNLQNRPPTLDISPTEDARNLDTNSG